MNNLQLSVVIPVYNEEEGLQALFDRLYPALDQLNISYEILFINDGSRDRSPAILREQFQQRPDVTRVILFNGNFGQHMAIMAGFEHARGQRVVTLDADLQNPPEEIGKLLAKMDEGYDYIGSIRNERNDSMWRHVASRAMNNLRERITRIKITDQGCMLRAYDRGIIDAINSCKEVNTFIPALAYTFARNPAEVVVEHEERALGESKYSLYSLIRLNFDLMTGFSVVPLQWFSLVGMLTSVVSALFFVLLVVRRLIIGPEAEGLFTLFALVFFMIGITLFGIGLLGEYVGRIYQQVRHRPRYLVEAVLEQQGREKGEGRRVKPATATVAGEVDPFAAIPEEAAAPSAPAKPAVPAATEPKKRKPKAADDTAHPSLFSDIQE
ncbi:MAG TPA: glycosyltransferase [Gallionella sp.]|nr:glycosyltransferase [Gallionella sp.]